MKMKMLKKVLSAVTASALTLSMAAGSAAMFSSVSAAAMDSVSALAVTAESTFTVHGCRQRSNVLKRFCR